MLLPEPRLVGNASRRTFFCADRERKPESRRGVLPSTHSLVFIDVPDSAFVSVFGVKVGFLNIIV